MYLNLLSRLSPSSSVRCASWVVLLFVLLIGSGCKKRLVHYRTGEHLNASPQAAGQPVMLGFYQLSRRPDGLRDLTCSQLSSAAAAQEVLSDVLLGEVLISVVPDKEKSTEFTRKPGAKWVLIVPFFERCDRSVSSWALVRTRYLRRRIYVTLNSYRIRLPWEAPFRGKPSWRQRGNIDGESYRVLWRVR